MQSPLHGSKMEDRVETPPVGVETQQAGTTKGDGRMDSTECSTGEFVQVKRRVWRERSASKRQTTKIQNATEREKNAWDFLLTIRSPENMVRRKSHAFFSRSVAFCIFVVCRLLA